MPWNPARLVLENGSEALRQSLYRRSGIAIPEALIGVLQSLDELDVDQMIAGNSDELSWPTGILTSTHQHAIAAARDHAIEPVLPTLELPSSRLWIGET